jgi:serine/threonine protein phosphatase PrpC
MKFQISAVSDIGCVRTNNEDMLVVNDQFVRDGSYTGELLTETNDCFIAVADGMGGHNAGELASEFVLQRMSAMAKSLPAAEDEAALQTLLDKHIREIHVSLNQLGIHNPELRGLGCTFTGLLVHQGQLYLVHVGDSRLYRQRRLFLTLLTKDHTLRNMLNDPSIPANKIANSFGGGAGDIFFDFEMLTDRVFENDILLLCSDGLSGEITDEQIETALAENADAAKLVQMARSHGGNDNISCIVITVRP